MLAGHSGETAPPNHIAHRLRLSRARGNQNNPLRLHDAVDAHCQRVARHVGIREEAFVCIQRALRKRHLICCVREFFLPAR